MGAGEDRGDELRGVVLAVRRGSIVVQAAGGPADVDTGVACTTDTRFAVASVSKQFTAAAVLLLVERGAVGLIDPLSRWFGHGPGPGPEEPRGHRAYATREDRPRPPVLADALRQHHDPAARQRRL